MRVDTKRRTIKRVYGTKTMIKKDRILVIQLVVIYFSRSFTINMVRDVFMYRCHEYFTDINE